MKSAKSVLSHIKDAGKPMALFGFRKDTYKVLVAGGKRAEVMIKDFPHTFMGVYTPDCPLEWLEADLA